MEIGSSSSRNNSDSKASEDVEQSIAESGLSEKNSDNKNGENDDQGREYRMSEDASTSSRTNSDSEPSEDDEQNIEESGFSEENGDNKNGENDDQGREERMNEDESIIVIDKQYKDCAKCQKKINRVRSAQHSKICGDKKTCDEKFEGKVCGAKYITQRQHKRHCMFVEGKKHIEGTCERLHSVKPYEK